MTAPFAVSTKAVALSVLDLMADVGGPLEAATLILVANNFTPTKNLLMAGIVEATFVGYAAVAGLVFGSAFQAADGSFRINAPSETFEMSGAGTPNVIYGWALVNAGKTTLYYAAMLETPISLSAVSQGLTVLPEVVFGF